MKIRIFTLAQELGMDSKLLIEQCNSAGVELKNSALASISPEERDIVLAYIKGREPVARSESVVEPMAPKRESGHAQGGKVRAIGAMTARPQNGSRTTLEQGATATVEAEPRSSQSRVLDPGAPEDDLINPAEGAEVSTDQLEDSTTDEGRETAKSQTSDFMRGDYVPPSGGSIREMKPRGTVPNSDSFEGRGSRNKAKRSLPPVAVPPTEKLPKAKAPKKAEIHAQKPDIPLTADALAQHSPLKAHLQDHKKKKKKGAEKPPLDRGAAMRLGRSGPLEDEERQQRRSRRGTRQFEQDEAGTRRGRSTRRRRQKSSGPVELKTSAQIELPMTIRTLSEAMGRPAKTLQSILFGRGQMITINDNISEETALELAMEVGVDLEVKRPHDIEDDLSRLAESVGPVEMLEKRPPIVTILGHVDHGKTTMLDKIRSADVAGGEAGGITQHIAAYQVTHNGEKVTFVDTPGHAAFAEMRARGANVTDIVVLVVAADDGVMPQTAECISHAKAAGVPMVVALNKVDLPGRNEEKVLQELAAKDVLPAEWGGDVEVVRTSGETGEGLDTLLDTLLITAELNEFKANVQRSADGVCLEAFRDEGRGVLAWMVVQKGTLRIGDVILCGESYGRVRAIYNDRDEEVAEAGPSMPIKVAGLNVVPDAGKHFYVLSDIEQAREAAENRIHRGRSENLTGRPLPRSLDDILASARGGEVQDLPLIVKADTPGSIEALKGELEKLDHPEVRVQFVHTGVGGVNESDVALASASGAIIIAFHVVPEDRALQQAASEGVEIRRYNVIYEITETIKNALEGMLIPEKVQVQTGRALVLRTFKVSRFGVIAGCRVLSGTLGRNDRVHFIRDQTVIGDYAIASLKREKDDAKEVREGMECGIRLEGFNDVKEGDLMEAFRVDEIKRKLD